MPLPDFRNDSSLILAPPARMIMINFDQEEHRVGKARLADIAREAGVGTATVERVLNERGGVAADTARKVILAAKRLGYRRNLPEAHRGTIRIEVVMVRPETPFFDRLNKAFERISASLDSSILVHRTFSDEADPAKFAQHILTSTIRRSGLIVVAVDHPDVRRSLDKLRSDGVVVVHVVSPTGRSEDIFVGIDNYAAGRTAGLYMHNMLRGVEGKVLGVCHSWVYRVHRERIRGFSDFLRDRPDTRLDFSEVLFSLDDEVRAAEVLRSALEREENVVGVYNAGGANEGIASVLHWRRSMGRQPILWLGHELTDQTRQYLKSGLMTVAFDQAPEIQARRSLDTIMKRLGVINVDVSTDPVPFLTYTPENV